MTILKTLSINQLKWRHWLLLVLLLLVNLTKFMPQLGDVYTHHIYPIIGATLSPLSGLLPFALGDLFIACSIGWVIVYPIYGIAYKKYKKTTVLWRVTEYLLWIYVWFYLAWGLNYSQHNIYQRIGMSPAEVSEAKFKAFAYRYADSLNLFYNKAQLVKSEKGIVGISDKLKKETEVEILKGYKNLETAANRRYSNLGINPHFNNSPHAKTMVFSWLSSMAGVTGSMGPFFCEFTLNGDVLPQNYPATYAHEFAHFLGIANEGEANFYSYIVCTASTDKTVKFSGYYQIFFHVLANVYNLLGEKEYERYLKMIRPEIKQLAREERQYWLSKRCKLLDDVQDFIFDLYLKGNKVEEGRKSYSGVIGLILSWEEMKH